MKWAGWMMTVAVLSLGAAGAGAETTDHGAAFNEAARGYDAKAATAMKRAARSSGDAAGRFITLSRVYRRMASIKRRAATLARQDRWDEIRWDDYHALEAKRDALIAVSSLYKVSSK